MDTQTNTYNPFNQLVQVIITSTDDDTDNITATYTYRTDGLRHSKSVDGDTTTHIWDRNHIILELNNNGRVANRFHRGLGSHLINSDNHGWYIFDGRGSVVQRVSGIGQVLHAYRYTAFGVELGSNSDSTSPSNPNPWRLNGEYWDAETQTYYLRARHFNPRTGRFTQEDPHWHIGNMQSDAASIIQSGNLYMFTMHNPVMWADPSGLFAILPIFGDFFRAFEIYREFGVRVVMGVYDIHSRANARTSEFMRRHELETNYFNTADAYRHFTGSFYMTRELGIDVARFVGAMNEMRDSGFQLMSSNGGVHTAMITGGVLQDLWNDAAGRNFALNHPGLTSTDAFNLASLQGRVMTDLNNIWERLGVAGLPHVDTRAGEPQTWIRVIWNESTDRITFTDIDGHRPVTFILGGEIPERRAPRI